MTQVESEMLGETELVSTEHVEKYNEKVEGEFQNDNDENVRFVLV